MIRHKWSLKVRNQLASLAMECDSCAAECAKLTSAERSALQQKLRDVVFWMDERMK